MTGKKKVLLLAIIFLIAFRLYLPTLIKNYVNKELNKDPVYRGHIEDVRVHLWRGAYSIEDLKIVEVHGQKTFPFLSANEIDIGLSWKDLFHRRIVAKLFVTQFEINIVQEPKAKGSKITIGASTKEGKEAEAHSWKDVFNKLVPLDVNRVIIAGGSIHYRDLTSQPKLDVYLDELNVKALNLVNTIKGSQLFGTVDLAARAMKSGDLHIHFMTDIFKSPPEFKATLILKNLDLTKLNDLFTAYENIDVKKGRFSLYSEIATADNNVKGYIKPLIEDLKVANFKKDFKKYGLIHAFWEEIVGFAAGILKNFPKDRQALVIPVEGKLNDPKTNGWDIAKSILHNMFIKPIHPQLDHSVKLKDVKGN